MIKIILLIAVMSALQIFSHIHILFHNRYYNQSTLNINIKEVLFVIITTIYFTLEFIAYDCEVPNLNITSFDSLEVDNCDLPIPSKTEQVTRIQLLQRVETYSVNFKLCLIN